ncbi:MAG: long-chain fatty acid--CoA ligase [Rhodobacteraceae bacterium]|nr:long-chain fatty acid--CoA ligase [Paracoccaceae bacterium]
MDFEAATKRVLDTDDLYQVSEYTFDGQIYKRFVNTPQTLHELLEYGKETRQWDEFIVYENERITYSEFLEKVNSVAAFLQKELGVKKGDKVAIAMRNFPEYPILLMGIVSVGAIVVFVNAWWTTSEMEYGFYDSSAKICFADIERLKAILPFSKDFGIKLIGIRSEHGDNFLDYEKEVASYPAKNLQVPNIDPNDEFGIMYTSGSTGEPKGVVLSHRGAISAVFSWLMMEKIGSYVYPEKASTKKPSSILLLSPLFHVNGSHPNFLYGIAKGSKIALMYKWDPKKAVDIIENETITLIRAVPTVISDLVEEAIAQNKSLSSLETLNAGGAKRPPPNVAYEKKALPSTDISSGYGMTETNALGIGVSGDEYLENPELAGRLIGVLQDIKIVDENDMEVKYGDVGEIAIKSPANMLCYLNKKKETDEVLIDGWMHTGDLGHMNSQGLVTIVDRKKNIIIRGGENISCLEVEGMLQKHQSILESIVFAVPNERFGEEVGACINLKKKESLQREEIYQFLNDKLAKFKIPAHYWLADDSLPRGATDKLDRITTRELCLDNKIKKLL